MSSAPVGKDITPSPVPLDSRQRSVSESQVKAQNAPNEAKHARVHVKGHRRKRSQSFPGLPTPDVSQLTDAQLDAMTPRQIAGMLQQSPTAPESATALPLPPEDVPDLQKRKSRPSLPKLPSLEKLARGYRSLTGSKKFGDVEVILGPGGGAAFLNSQMDPSPSVESSVALKGSGAEVVQTLAAEAQVEAERLAAERALQERAQQELKELGAREVRALVTSDAEILLMSQDPIEPSYVLTKTVGEGATATCFAARRNDSFRDYVVKKLQLQRIDASDDGRRAAFEALKEELTVTRKLGSTKHHVVMIHDVLKDGDDVYIVMDDLGQELQPPNAEDILKIGPDFAAHNAAVEKRVKSQIKQLLIALSHCHKNGYGHGDVKHKNVLTKTVCNSSGVEEERLTLIDFGSARKKRTHRQHHCTADFVAPESLLRERLSAEEKRKSARSRSSSLLGRSSGATPLPDEPAFTQVDFRPLDMWATGVLTVLLLQGHMPFDADTKFGIYDNIREQQPQLQPALKHCASALDFVMRLLDKDPKKRLTAADALKHSWLKDA